MFVKVFKIITLNSTSPHIVNRQIGPSIFNTSSLAALRIVKIGVKIDQSCSIIPTKHPGGENTSILCYTYLNILLFELILIIIVNKTYFFNL